MGGGVICLKKNNLSVWFNYASFPVMYLWAFQKLMTSSGFGLLGFPCLVYSLCPFRTHKYWAYAVVVYLRYGSPNLITRIWLRFKIASVSLINNWQSNHSFELFPCTFRSTFVFVYFSDLMIDMFFIKIRQF